MSLALQRNLKPATGYPALTEPREGETRLNIAVAFTTVEATLAALRKAGTLANRLGAHITLLVPQVVPYPLPLESPPVLLDWNERRFRVISAASPVDTTVHLYLCRDGAATLLNALRPRSMVVLGGRKRWWPTSETKLARKLRNAGHEVIFVETE
ncbi:MAG: hypothetical protein ABI811_09530 [Acidobacteriota bacterium]